MMNAFCISVLWEKRESGKNERVNGRERGEGGGESERASNKSE